jgi:hypothetical protein
MTTTPSTTQAAHLLPAPPLAQIAADGRGISLSTPRLIHVGLAAMAASLLLFWGAGTGIVFEAKTGVQTIGHDTAPSIVAAQQIRANLADLNANAANAALTRGAAAAQAWSDYRNDQAALSDHLVSAAQNITYGDAERKPIVAIATRVQAYEDLIGQARALMAAADPSQTTAPEAALALVRQAASIMDGELLPAADALNNANETVLEQTWSSRKSAFLFDTVGLVGCGVPAVLILLLLQKLVSGRTRRIFNPMMMAATCIMIVGALWAGFGIESSANALTSAKQDAFDSVRAMWKSRSIAYSANADESFFLLDRSGQQGYLRQFQAKLGKLTWPAFTQEKPRGLFLSAIRNYEANDCTGQHQAFAGLFGDELGNVTFPGECKTAAGIYTTYAGYIAIDGRIRELEAAGQHDAAVALCIGSKPGESNYAFALFDTQIDRVIDINQREFDDLIARAADRLAPLPWIIGIASLLAGLLTLLGARPILNEYRA